MSGVSQFESDCPPLKKRKCISDNSLLYLFVDYVAAHEPDTRTPEEIRACVQILQRKTISTTLTPFQKVASQKLNRLLPILLACNEDVNFVGNYSQTILHIFVHIYADKTVFPQTNPVRDQEIVKTLLERGASVDVVDSTKNTPLHYAAINRRTDLVQLMLAGFINVNAQNREMNTVLHLLIESYNDQLNHLDLEAIRILVSKGADFITPMNKLKMSPFHIAIKHCSIKVLQIFKMKFDYRDEVLLLDICKNAANWLNHPEELQHVNRLVDLSECVNCCTEQYHLTPLHYVSKFGRMDAVELFLSAGADIDAVTVDGVTPLHLAVMEGQGEVAKFLIERGANLQARDTVFNFGLMHMAMFKGNRNIIDLLLKRELAIEDQGRVGLTPLHLAAMKGDDWTIKRLIGQGADVNCRTFKSQLSPLHLVVRKERCINSEKAKSQRISMVLLYFNSLTQFKPKPVESLIMLLQAGANVNARDYQFRTPLHCAVSYSEFSYSADCLLTLLEHGAHVDVREKNGKTPMAMAYLNGYFIREPYSSESLLRYGADIDYVDISRISSVFSKDGIYGGYVGLIQYIALIQAIDLPVKDNQIGLLSKCLTFRTQLQMKEDKNRLDNEIAKLKTHYLKDGETLLYDFLHMNSKHRLNFAESVLSLDLETEYPLYRVVIENSCRRAINEKLFTSLASSALNRLVQFKLPDTCTEIIFGFMNTLEMTFFIHSVDSLTF